MLPAYISDTGHGAASHEAPLLLTHVQSYFFTLRVQQEPLQAFIDGQLNRVSRGAVHYRALPWVLNCWYRSARGTSLAEAGGYMPSNECLFVVPLLQTLREQPQAPQLKAWIPYLFIDQQDALITAREVWGYRKTLGRVAIPESPDAAVEFGATATVFPGLDRSREGREMKLVSLRRTAAPGPLQSRLADAAGGLRQLIGRLGGVGDADWAHLAEHAVERLYDLLPTVMFPLINLKQFRDAADSSRACYQALVECPTQLVKLHGGGLLPGDYSLEIPYVESHTIVKDLGLVTAGGAAGDGPRPRAVMHPALAQWATMDLKVVGGSVIWEADAHRD
ncbi:MAG: hypothetical protein P4L83_14285 [Nevskia sp.]|nr:hypothetical protein [Nevskia sp.]